MTFKELKLHEQLLEAISYMGFENATPIQEQAIPLIINNKDLIACAQTGTGKTGAFVLPILHKLIGKEDNAINTLIIVPTRELAIQIEQQIEGLSYFLSVGSIAVYGGGNAKDWSTQEKALQNGTDVVVATPGKLLSLLKIGTVKLDKLEHLILDEADRMLNMGFVDDIKEIISYLPKNRQTLLFSATMPKSIEVLAQSILTNPEKITLSISKPAAGVTQKVYLTYDNQKIKLIDYLLKERKHYESIVIFTSTKSKVNEIVRALNRSGNPAQGISSNLDQDKREDVLRTFRSKQTRILVGTDVISRGIDIKDINMVINFDAPMDAEDYVHRIGRTARANTKGEAVTLVNEKDMHRLRKIEKLIEKDFEKLQPPTQLGEGPQWKERSKSSASNGRPNQNKPKPQRQASKKAPQKSDKPVSSSEETAPKKSAFKKRENYNSPKTDRPASE